MSGSVAFVFPGQGAQYPGMLREIYDEFGCARDVFSAASDALHRDIPEICFNGSQSDLDDTLNTQVCVLAADLAVAAVLREEGISPCAGAGFSLGEYAALADAGALDLRDCFRIVQLRAEAMRRAVPAGCGMAAVIGTPSDRVRELCSRVTRGYVAPANYNAPLQTTVAGDGEGLAELLALAETEHIRCQRLAVSVPSHCELMRPAAEELKTALAQVRIGLPEYELPMNADPFRTPAAEDIRELACLQLVSPVRWVEIQQRLEASGADVWIECGPGHVLCGLARRTVPGIKAMHVENTATLRQALDSLRQC